MRKPSYRYSHSSEAIFSNEMANDGLYPSKSINGSIKSIKSDESSLNSVNTRNSQATSIQNKVKNMLSRRRSQSLNLSSNSSNSDVYSNSSQDSSQMTGASSGGSRFKLMRNKSLASIFPSGVPSLARSSSSTRDNSISSMGDIEVEMAAGLSPVSPLTRIEENSNDRSAIFANYQIVSQTSLQQKQKLIERMKHSNKSVETTDIDDVNLYDDIADHILRKVSISEQDVSSIEWNI